MHPSSSKHIKSQVNSKLPLDLLFYLEEKNTGGFKKKKELVKSHSLLALLHSLLNGHVMFDQDTFPIWEVIKWSLTWVSQKIKGLLICVAKVLCNIPCSCAVKKKSRLLVQHERLGYALKFIWKWCQTNYRKIIILSCQTGPLVGDISTKYIGKCVAHGNQNAALLLCVILCATSSLISAGGSSKGIDVSCILCEMIAWKDVIPSFQWRFSLPENEMEKKNTFCTTYWMALCFLPNLRKGLWRGFSTLSLTDISKSGCWIEGHSPYQVPV